MEDIIINDEIMGRLIYNQDTWIKADPIKYEFNGEDKQIVIEIDILDGELTEYELGIGIWDEDDFDEDEIEEHKEYKEAVNFMYKNYIIPFPKTIKFIKEIILKDYDNFINETKMAEAIEIIGQGIYEDIIKDNSKVFNMIELGKITIFNNRVRILGKSKWYINNEFGVKLWKDGSYTIGNLDTIY